MAMVGRRPRSDEYNPTPASDAPATTAAAAAGREGVVNGGAGETVMNIHHARPAHYHYSDYAQVTLRSFCCVFFSL